MPTLNQCIAPKSSALPASCLCLIPLTFRGVALFLACPILATVGTAQSAPSSVNPAALAKWDKNKNGRLDPDELAAKNAAEAAGATNEVINLTPFEVSVDASDTYQATNTNSITGTNVALGKTALDAKVFNRQLMDELGVVDMTEMLSKLGGLGSAIIAGGNEEVRGDLEGDRQDPKSMTMRGLTINNPRRDGFLRADTALMDSFDVERVDALGGSNSLLFGSGDAGGVITTNSKRALVGRRQQGSFTAGGDSEGSRRYTLDFGAGFKYWGFRINAVHGDTKYFRPANRQLNEGLTLATTVRPWKNLEIRGEWRHLIRDTTYPNSGTVRAPLTQLLPTGERVDNQSTRYLAAFPNASALTDGLIDVTKADTLFGPYYAFAFKNLSRSVVAEAKLAEGLGLQVRYGHDARVNNALSPTNNSIFAPGAAGNLYADPATGLIGTKWAFNMNFPVLNPFHTGARGYRAALAYQKNLGRWGSHQASAFFQDMESWTNQDQWRFYEADASGNAPVNPALITVADLGRIPIPSFWVPINPTGLVGGKKWPFSSLVHPNGKTYVSQPLIFPGAVPPTAGNPLGLSGPINPTTGQSTVGGYSQEDVNERSSGLSVFSEWWKGRIDTMVGYRTEEASGLRRNVGLKRGPISYDSLTTGAVVDTPLKGVRVSFNYATNAKINFDTTRDIYNQPLPPGKGVSKDIGLKFGLWQDRVSGNFNYYQSEAQNFTATFGNRNDVDPDGINGRNGGPSYTYSKTSDGYNLTLSARPTRGWEIRVNFATANGSERTERRTAAILQRPIQYHHRRRSDGRRRPRHPGRSHHAPARAVRSAQSRLGPNPTLTLDDEGSEQPLRCATRHRVRSDPQRRIAWSSHARRRHGCNRTPPQRAPTRLRLALWRHPGCPSRRRKNHRLRRAELQPDQPLSVQRRKAPRTCRRPQQQSARQSAWLHVHRRRRREQTEDVLFSRSPLARPLRHLPVQADWENPNLPSDQRHQPDGRQ
jgi:outer membrane receptor protein involved in Fe transport